MRLVLLREEWISLFGHGPVFMLSTRFVRTSGNSLSHKTWIHFLFAQHLKAYLMLGLWETCLRYDNFFLMLETEESISEIDGHHILQEASELRSLTELNGVLAIWAHKHAGNYVVCVNNFCLQVRFCCNTTFRGFIELQSRNFISDYERSIGIGTITSGGFVNTSVSKSWTISVTCFNIFLLIHRFRPKISCVVSREFWC